jgi:hypothetical protein
MHARLIHDHVRALPYLMLIFMRISHGFAHASMFISKIDRCHAYVTRSAMFFFPLRLPEWSWFFDR